MMTERRSSLFAAAGARACVTRVSMWFMVVVDGIEGLRTARAAVAARSAGASAVASHCDCFVWLIGMNLEGEKLMSFCLKCYRSFDEEG